MTLQKFQQLALNEFTREITDVFFQYIENNKTLFQEYLRVIGRDAGLDATNMALGAAVKDWFHLENSIENQNPKSKLIKSYTEHHI
jgi:hypothetical protein